jgi:hypothetical protein
MDLLLRSLKDAGHEASPEAVASLQNPNSGEPAVEFVHFATG